MSFKLTDFNERTQKQIQRQLHDDVSARYSRQVAELESNPSHAPLETKEVQRSDRGRVLDEDNDSDYLGDMNFDIEKLYEAYLRTGSVHRAATEFNTTGETVRQKLIKAGKKLIRSKWTDGEIQAVKRAYASPIGFNLPLLAKMIGRTYAGVAGKADDLGLCSERGKQIVTASARENMSRAQKEVSSRPGVVEKRAERLAASRKKNGHPRGMLGKTHAQSARDAISAGNTGTVRPMEMTVRSMQTKMVRYGTMSPNVKRGSWKAAWRIIGGIRKFYRSAWEANYARYLEYQKQHGLIKDWKHETETFWFDGISRGCVCYLPDFKITNNDGTVEFHEVKGWMDARSKTKIRRMAKYHPTVKLKVFDSKWYRANSRNLAGLIREWE
jgi:hypothetical protein